MRKLVLCFLLCVSVCTSLKWAFKSFGSGLLSHVFGAWIIFMCACLFVLLCFRNVWKWFESYLKECFVCVCVPERVHERCQSHVSCICS